VLKDLVSEETRFEARINIKNTMDSIRYGNSIDVKPIRNSVCKMIDELMEVKDTMVNLQDLKSNDQYTFSHSVNVCVLSLITGISMNYDEEKLRELGIGAMLHDIGKIRIPNEILNKPESLTAEEFKIIKKHTNYGYEILKKSKVLSTYASYIALTHHERCDGEGYPLGLRGEEIHEFSRIVSIADVYDAITSDRIYKKRTHVNDAVEYLIGMGDHQFDYNIVRSFIEHITIYPPGTCVLLNNGEKAIVVDVNKKYPNRPIIRIFADGEGQFLKEPVEVDMTKNNTLLISEIIDDI
jgi:putative nucleotidyltransferase with HDIG domain